jgi:hypothetical protein
MSKPKAKRPIASKPKPVRVLVVYGFDENKKPRAAKFSEPEFKLARRAADLMKLEAFETDVPKLRRAFKKLPAGKVYASGWGFVPNVRQNQFNNLLRIIEATEFKEPESPSQTNLPASWDAIAADHLVLGQADAAEDGWWPAIVESVDGDMLVLQARDFPEAPTVTRHRSSVALLYTAEFEAPEHTGSFAPGLPVSWATLVFGQLVLAQDTKPENGWWEAEIVEMEGDYLTLQWRDFPRQPKVKRHRTAVALLNPVPPQKS